MITVNIWKHEANRIRRQKARREHKQFHTRQANDMRAKADALVQAGFMSETQRQEFEFEAIAEENAKCMNRH